MLQGTQQVAADASKFRRPRSIQRDLVNIARHTGYIDALTGGPVKNWREEEITDRVKRRERLREIWIELRSIYGLTKIEVFRLMTTYKEANGPWKVRDFLLELVAEHDAQEGAPPPAE